MPMLRSTIMLPALALSLVAITPWNVQGQETAAAPPASPPVSIVEACAQAQNLRTLTVALEMTGLDQLLESSGEFTLFAPSDQAFAKLPPGFLRQLLDTDNVAGLRALLMYHIVPVAVGAQDLRQITALRTLNSQHLDIEAFPAGFTIDTNARITDADIIAKGGVIHTIDTVLMPSTKTLLQSLRADKQFSIIVDLIEAADLEGMFNDRSQSWTFFAPTDDVILDLSVDLPDVLSDRRNRSALKRVIQSHMVEGVQSSEALLQASPMTSAGDSMIAINRTDRGLVVNGAPVAQANIDAVGGIIHAVEGLYLPNDLKLRVNGALQVGLFLEDAPRNLRRRLDAHDAQLIYKSTSGNARRAGLRRGDVILAIDGWDADEIDEAKREKGYLGRVTLTIYRNGQTIEVIVPVGRSN